ncbi:MAG TPA: DUF1614 domain-containing protein [Beijerinckiaceae bacterium]|nr:DUF1614 domain-containing protein [Beijerinckiaceae bacterium]
MNHFSEVHYLPVPMLFFGLLVGVFLILVFLIEIGVLRYAYLSLGVSPRMAFLLLFGSLIGAYINIPITELPPEHMESAREISYFGMKYIVPVVVDSPGTIIAINVGGAVIPIFLSLYLVIRNQLWVPAIVATALVTIIIHRLAEPVHGVGIAIPTFVPPIATVIVACIVSFRNAAPLAYIAGSLGTLIGADLLNLSKVAGLGAPVASIGGAGTFDGIFVTGMLALLLATLIGGPTHPRVVRRAT